MGQRTKTFDSTGIAPNGKLYAGDLNAIQDAKADTLDFTQLLSLGTLRIGDAAIQLLKFGTLDARLTAALRTDGILRGLGGLFAGTFTTAQRDAIASGSRPYGLVILNTDSNRLEMNYGTDASPQWGPVADPGLFGDGSDGDVTLNATTTLTRDMYYNTLNVNGQIVNMNGYRIFCKTRITMNSGSLRANGGNASGANPGTTPGGSIFGSASGGTTGGAGGGAPPADLLGGGGGNGGAGAGTAGFSGVVSAGANRPRAAVEAVSARAGSASFYGGGGGGQGGYDSGSGGNPGGGGGAGGGTVLVVAREMIFNAAAEFQAKGGNGAAGPTAGTGGGGGGGGGSVVLIRIARTSMPTQTLTGGTAGAGNGSGGVAGSAGSAGTLYDFTL